MKKNIAIFILIQGFTACTLINHSEFASNNKSEYLHSKNGQGLSIQKPLSDANISDFYQLPNQTSTIKVISIKPPVIQASE